MVPVPRGCATTVSSRPLGTGSGARGSLPRPQRLQHAQNCIEVLMFRTRSGSQINQYTATPARKSAKKASSDLRASTPERIDQVHHAHRKTNKKAERTHPFFRSHVLVPPAIRGLWQHQKNKEPAPHLTKVANTSHGKNPPGAIHGGASGGGSGPWRSAVISASVMNKMPINMAESSLYRKSLGGGMNRRERLCSRAALPRMRLKPRRSHCHSLAISITA